MFVAFYALYSATCVVEIAKLTPIGLGASPDTKDGVADTFVLTGSVGGSALPHSKQAEL